MDLGYEPGWRDLKVIAFNLHSPFLSTNQPRSPASYVWVLVPLRTHRVEEVCRVSPKGKRSRAWDTGQLDLSSSHFLYFPCQDSRHDLIWKGVLLLKRSLKTISLGAGGCHLFSISSYIPSLSHTLFPTLSNRTTREALWSTVFRKGNSCSESFSVWLMVRPLW